MEENQQGLDKSSEGHYHGMGKGMCHCGFGHRYVLLRWLLGIIILAMVFCLGVKIGEFKGSFGGEFGGYGSYHGHHRMMKQPMYYGGYMMDNGMMGSSDKMMPPQVAQPQSAAPVK